MWIKAILWRQRFTKKKVLVLLSMLSWRRVFPCWLPSPSPVQVRPYLTHVSHQDNQATDLPLTGADEKGRDLPLPSVDTEGQASSEGQGQSPPPQRCFWRFWRNAVAWGQGEKPHPTSEHWTVPCSSGHVIYGFLVVELTGQQALSKSLRLVLFPKNPLHRQLRRDTERRKALLSRHTGNELIITVQDSPMHACNRSRATLSHCCNFSQGLNIKGRNFMTEVVAFRIILSKKKNSGSPDCTFIPAGSSHAIFFLTRLHPENKNWWQHLSLFLVVKTTVFPWPFGLSHLMSLFTKMLWDL